MECDLHSSSQPVHFRDILSSDFSEVQLKAVVTNFDKRHAGSKYYVSTLVQWCETASGACTLTSSWSCAGLHPAMHMALYVLEKLPICIIFSISS